MVAEILIVFAALALGGFVKGATGAGMPVVAVPVLASFFDVPFAIAIMVVPTIVTNLLQIRQFIGARQAVGRMRWMFAGAFAGILCGTWLLTMLPATLLSGVLAAVIVLYIGLRLAKPDWHLPEPAARRLAPAAGLVSGVLQGATGISAPVSITFLSAIGLSRDQFILTISVLFVTFAATQIPVLAATGILTVERAALGLMAVVPVAAAMPFGNRLARRMGPRGFDRLILMLLAAMAAKLAVDSGLFG